MTNTMTRKKLTAIVTQRSIDNRVRSRHLQYSFVRQSDQLTRNNLVCAKLKVFPSFSLGNHRAVKIIRTDINERVNNNYF